MIFNAPKNYGEMLNKIGIFTAVEVFLSTIFAGYISPVINQSLINVSMGFVYETSGLKFPIGYLLPPILIGVFARLIKLHDKVSDLLKIRENFDVHYILLPMCKTLNINKSLNTLRTKRDKVMWDVFYKYASSTKPEIDPHYIIMALDSWCWYWILLELRLVGIGLIMVLLLYKALIKAIIAVILSILLISILSAIVKNSCKRYALVEVNEILSSSQRKSEVTKVLNAL